MTDWKKYQLKGGWFHLFLPALLVCAVTPVSAGESILPAQPAEILKLLPKTPEGWKLLQSRAENLYSDWIFTEAFREFESLPQTDPAKPNEPPPPPGRTRLRVTDTGYWPAANTMFSNFTPGTQSPEGISKKMFGKYPMLSVKLPGGSERGIVWVKNRFVVVVELENQKPTAMDDWLKAIDLAGLDNVPDGKERKLPSPMRLTVFDEMRPANNRTYTMFPATDNVEIRR